MKASVKSLLIILILTLSSICFAYDESGRATTWGEVSDIATGLIYMGTNLMAASFFFIGIGFSVGAATRIRNHFKNPTVIPFTSGLYMALFAIVLFCFSLFNHWKQDEVFGDKKPKAITLNVNRYSNLAEKKSPEQHLQEVNTAAKTSSPPPPPSHIAPKPQERTSSGLSSAWELAGDDDDE